MNPLLFSLSFEKMADYSYFSYQFVVVAFYVLDVADVSRFVKMVFNNNLIKLDIFIIHKCHS